MLTIISVDIRPYTVNAVSENFKYMEYQMISRPRRIMHYCVFFRLQF